MSKWIAEFDLEDGDTMPEHMDLNYMGARIDFHCRPIPDNATNGDVIKTMFPDAEIHLNENEVFFHHIGFWIKCNIRWWNAPYQKGGKE